MASLRFELTEQHIALLQRAYFTWNDCDYNGAIEQDLKRPYGTSGDIVPTIAEMIGIPPDCVTEHGEKCYSADTAKKCRKLHTELLTALQVILDTRSFVPGTYERTNFYSGPWYLA